MGYQGPRVFIRRRPFKREPVMRIFASVVVLGLLGVALGACSLVPGFAQVEGATVIGTKKTISDHIVSLASGKDCSTIRKNRDLTYCVEDEAVITPNIYCYNTLGRVTCYDRPDPHRGGYQKVGRNDHNLAK